LCALASAQTCDDTCSLILGSTNQARAQAGLPALCVNSDLMQAAMVQASYQAQTGVMSHTGAGGSNIGDRVSATGLKWTSCAENVAMGQTTAKEVMLAWMNSPEHRVNILSGNTEMGIARVGNFWSQTFAKPRTGAGGCNVGVPGGQLGSLPTQQPDVGPACDAFCQQLLVIVNQKRATTGSPPFCINAKLMQAATALAQARSLNNLQNAVDGTGFGTKALAASENNIIISTGQPSDKIILGMFQQNYKGSSNDKVFTRCGIASDSKREYWVVVEGETYTPDEDKCAGPGGQQLQSVSRAPVSPLVPVAPSFATPPAAAATASSPHASASSPSFDFNRRCSQITDPCQCTGVCSWSTTHSTCNPASGFTFPDCQACPTLAQCQPGACSMYTSPCACASLDNCGWSTGSAQCLPGHQTDCTECPSQSGCKQSSGRKHF